MAKADLIPIADRPRFARKVLAVWRLHHLAAGEDLAILVYPGEWPDGVLREVKGVPVQEDERGTGGAGGVMVLGRIGEKWRAAFTLATRLCEDFTVDDLALTTAFLEVDPNREVTIWLSPSPETGEVPAWKATIRG